MDCLRGPTSPGSRTKLGSALFLWDTFWIAYIPLFTTNPLNIDFLTQKPFQLKTKLLYGYTNAKWSIYCYFNGFFVAFKEIIQNAITKTEKSFSPIGCGINDNVLYRIYGLYGLLCYKSEKDNKTTMAALHRRKTMGCAADVQPKNYCIKGDLNFT